MYPGYFKTRRRGYTGTRVGIPTTGTPVFTVTGTRVPGIQEYHSFHFTGYNDRGTTAGPPGTLKHWVGRRRLDCGQCRICGHFAEPHPFSHVAIPD
eukprot:501452-Rhodomonas_salina.1